MNYECTAMQFIFFYLLDYKTMDTCKENAWNIFDYRKLNRFYLQCTKNPIYFSDLYKLQKKTAIQDNGMDVPKKWNKSSNSYFIHLVRKHCTYFSTYHMMNYITSYYVASQNERKIKIVFKINKNTWNQI